MMPLRRVLWAAAVALSTGLTGIVALQGFSPTGWIRLVETLAVVGFGAALLFGVTSLVFVRMAGWRDPETEAEFDRVVLRAERLAREGLSVEPDETEFLELDPLDDDDFEEIVREALDELPDLLRNVLDHNVAVLISDDGRRHRAYGLYQGDGATRDNVTDRIVIFRDTLRRDFGHDADRLREQILVTVRHELASRGRSSELIADQVLAVFRGLSESWGPRLQVVLHAALLTLARRSDASLCALPALLTNPVVRRRLRAGSDDLALDQFWAWFEALSPAEQQQVVAPVLTRLQPVLLRSSVRTMVGQLQPRFRIEDIFTKRKVVLVALRRGVIGPEAAALLGSLFVTELWQAVLGRTAILPERRHPVIVYADEFQDYVHLPTDMADALAQARGLGVGLTLAHQHLAQLPANLRAAVLANARSRVCFQVSGEDANVMAKLAGDKLEPSDFQRLRRYEAYAQIVSGGEITDFASIRTLPLPHARVDPQEVRELSRQRYGRPVEQLEAEIRQLLEGEPDDDERLGVRERGRR